MGVEHALEGARLVVAWAHGFVSMELAGAFRLGGDVDEAFAFGVERLAVALASSRSLTGIGSTRALRTCPERTAGTGDALAVGRQRCHPVIRSRSTKRSGRDEMLIWSERRNPRMREMIADAATVAWVGLWAMLGFRLFGLLAELAGAGRLIQDGGTGLRSTGGEVAAVLQGVPLIGDGASERVLGAFGAAADPMIQFGSDVERVLFIIAALLGMLVVAVAVIPWLNRYVPWRMERLRRLNSGARVIQRSMLHASDGAGERQLREMLASRAIHRLEYDRLLEFTPDPFADWKAGRLDRLVEAELEAVGLAGTRRSGRPPMTPRCPRSRSPDEPR